MNGPSPSSRNTPPQAKGFDLARAERALLVGNADLALSLIQTQSGALRVAAKKRAPELLRAAAQGGVPEVARFLLRHAGGALSLDSDRIEALRLAARQNSGECLECVRLLLPAEKLSREPGGSLLAGIAYIGNVKALELLVPFCDPNARTSAGFTPFLAAVSNGSEAAARFLLPLSDPLAVTDRAETALIAAAATASDLSESLLHWLLAFCDPNAADSEGMTALMHSVSRGRFEAVAVLAPRSDPLQTLPGSSLDVMGLALALVSPSCAETLLARAPLRENRRREYAERALRRFGWDNVPVARAIVERESLRLDLSEAEPSGSPENSAPRSPAKPAARL